MLRPPHREYRRLWVYHLDLTRLPAIDHPDYIGGWREGDTVVLFFHSPQEELVAGLCAGHRCSVVYRADLDYRDWEMGCAIEPFRVGPLSVAPVWSGAGADIELDPSVVFGTGFHPTTRMCLEALVELAEGQPGELGRVQDLGCGTGLLGIAAARLGAAQVLALDENTLACQVARHNAIRNGVADRVQVVRGDLLQEPPDTAGVDLVMANLFHDLLARLFETDSFWRARRYIISGFFSNREDVLLAALPLARGRLLARRRREKWGLWVLENKER